jgi:hypothetical protein
LASIEERGVFASSVELRGSADVARRRLCVRVCAGTASALVTGLLLFAPVALSRPTAKLSLFVNFFGNGAIAVTLQDGTAVGSTSGAPSVIPAGYYSLVFSGPGGCSVLPVFHLTGPGTNIVANMLEGEATKVTNNANLLPNTTYTWTDDAFPGVVHTFTTSSNVVGTAPAPTTPVTTTPSSSKGVSNQDIVGSAVTPLRGRLTGAVSAAGQLSLAYRGQSVQGLKAGRYRITIDDRSSTDGFLLKRSKGSAVVVTGGAFMGKRSVSVDLTPGTWSFEPSPGHIAYTIVVA